MRDTKGVHRCNVIICMVLGIFIHQTFKIKFNLKFMIITIIEVIYYLFSTLMALYIGIFIPCNAVRLTVECKAKSKLATKNRRSRPPFLNEYLSIETHPTILKKNSIE